MGRNTIQFNSSPKPHSIVELTTLFGNPRPPSLYVCPVYGQSRFDSLLPSCRTLQYYMCFEICGSNLVNALESISKMETWALESHWSLVASLGA